MHRILTVLLLALGLVAPTLAKPAAKPTIRWAPTSDRGFDQATEEGRLIVQFFTAPACDACKALEKTTLQDAEVVQFVSDRFVAIRTDASKKENAEVLEEYGITTFPTVQFYTSAGKLISEATLRTFEAPEAFRTRLLDVASSRFGQSKAVVEKTPVLAPTGSASSMAPVAWEKPAEKPVAADSAAVSDSSATVPPSAPAATQQSPAPVAPASP